MTKTNEHDVAERLAKQIRFILEIDKLKQVLRRSYITDGSRRENDAEHSWHLAVMALLLNKHSADPNLDLLRVLKMVLVHDLAEIEAGDAFLYDATGAHERAECEHLATEKVLSLLPEDQAAELMALWEEFEEGVTPEARFAKALDRLQPLLLNHSAKGRTWREHGVTAEMAKKLNPPIISKGAPGLADYVKDLLDDAEERGYFYG